jgi:hypothetical protein
MGYKKEKELTMQGTMRKGGFYCIVKEKIFLTKKKVFHSYPAKKSQVTKK